MLYFCLISIKSYYAYNHNPCKKSGVTRIHSIFYIFTHENGINFKYRTFPNTNLCLSVYNQNQVEYIRNNIQNSCFIDKSEHGYVSRLFGFHTRPFEVEIKSALEQFCILSHPSGLRAFTRVPYKMLMNKQDVFEMIFQDSTLLTLVFDTPDSNEKAQILESFLLNHIIGSDVDIKLNMALNAITDKKGSISVNELAGMLRLNASTIFRYFNTYVGQSPKEYIQTVRFRYTLNNLLTHKYQNLTELTYIADFYDQSHLIKNFKKNTGNIPSNLPDQIKVEQEKLAWITNIPLA